MHYCDDKGIILEKVKGKGKSIMSSWTDVLIAHLYKSTVTDCINKNDK